MSQKLAFGGLGWKQIYNTIKDKDIYMLEKFDRLHLVKTFTSEKLKKFHCLKRFHLENALKLNFDKIPIFDHFLAGDRDNNFLNASDNFY